MTVRPVSLSQEKASILSSLTKQEYETVVLFCQERILADAEVLIQEGDQPVAMYILLSWLLRVYQERNGQETVLGYVYPGEIVGEIAIFKEGAPWRSAHVVSSGSSSLLVILAPIVRELSHKHPEIYQKIFHFIKNREASNMRKTEKTQK